MNVFVSIIAIADSAPIAAIKATRAVTGDSIAAIKDAIEQQKPVYTRELFLNDFAEVAQDLRRLVSSLPATGVTVRIMENDEEIEPDLLFNLLEGSDEYAG